MCFRYGARINSVVNLHFSDINFKDGLLSLKDSKTGFKTKEVSIHPKVLNLLNQQQKNKGKTNNDFVFSFLTYDYKKNAKQAAKRLRNKLHKYVPVPPEQLNSKRLSIHFARQTLTTFQFEAILENALISNQQLLRHKNNSEATKVYTMLVMRENILITTSMQFSP